ncbi:MAG: DUF2877 domain-containing protein [Proteobacteria bacterium]|nr:DUF2877 domain-containing protein [Pseudomonadota bacterium]
MSPDAILDRGLRVAAIGAKAHAALARSFGRARLLSTLSESIYATAAGEVIWLGLSDRTPHPRLVLLAESLPVGQDLLHIEFAGVEPWRPARRELAAWDIDRRRAAGPALCERLVGLAPAGGLGACLFGQTPTFPLDRAVHLAAAFVRASAAGDDAAVVAAALPLIGLGPGLTPSGDDFVGGLIFARRHIPATNARHWDDIAESLKAEAVRRTNRISAALFADLADGQSFALLHTLVEAMHGNDGDAAFAAARRFVAIGHSSGWDMLAGLIAGLTGALRQVHETAI